MEMPHKLVPHREEKLCECGHFEMRHSSDDDDGPVHDCPTCECEPEGTGDGECLDCDGTCEEFRPVRLCARTLTPMDEWLAYYERLGTDPPNWLKLSWGRTKSDAPVPTVEMTDMERLLLG